MDGTAGSLGYERIDEANSQRAAIKAQESLGVDLDMSQQNFKKLDSENNVDAWFTTDPVGQNYSKLKTDETTSENNFAKPGEIVSEQELNSALTPDNETKSATYIKGDKQTIIKKMGTQPQNQLSYSFFFVSIICFFFYSPLFSQKIYGRVYKDSNNTSKYELGKIENNDSCSLSTTPLFLFQEFSFFVNDSMEIRSFYDIDLNIQFSIIISKIVDYRIIPFTSITINETDYPCIKYFPIHIKDNFIVIDTGLNERKINFLPFIGKEYIERNIKNGLCK